MTKEAKVVLIVLVVVGVVLCAVAYIYNSNMPDITTPIPSPIHDIPVSTETKEYKSEAGGVMARVMLGNDKMSSSNGKTYMLITLTSKELVEAMKVQLPTNLSIVIDRSGSMQGDKLDYVKDALESTVSLLDEADRVSVVTYDDAVETVYSSESFDEESYLDAINKIETGGDTYLEGGVREGITNIKKTNLDGYVNRVVLLSDGLANVGVSDSTTLASIVEDLVKDEIVVSTIGVGSDYDERLMADVATAGNGNYYYLEEPKDAETIFAEEFENAVSIVAKDFDVDFNLHDDFKMVGGVGYTLEEMNRFSPNNLPASTTKTYLFEISSEDAEVGEYALSNLEINFSSLVSSEKEKISLPIQLEVTKETVNSLASDIVYAEYMKAFMADEYWAVYEDLDIMNNSDAKAKMDTLSTELNAANTRLDGQFDNEVSEVEEKQEFLEDLGSSDVNASEPGKSFQKSGQSSSAGFSRNK